ncbi:MAG TPA: hypothetical protein PLX85_01350, partial [Dehalococcoidia bacterium]|nr:hypothetical protein [Dehalococcoidia bacterium]
TATPPAPPKADAATPAAVQGSGSGSTQVAPALPADSITSTPVAEERVAAPSIAPSTGSLGAGIGTDSPSGRVIVPAPAANDDWGQAAVRVSVTSREGIDSVRASEFGLGALALGLGGLTGWFWYLRRREAAANV